MTSRWTRLWPSSRGKPLALAVICFLVPLATMAQSAPGDTGDWKASGKNGAVVAGGAGAVAAGLEILKSGGNAVDAAVATILALTVTDATSVCFGGEVPIMIYDSKTGAIEVVAGQGAAPALATREFFAARGGIPAKGLEPAAVPGLLDACLTALDRRGTLTFAQSAAPMLRLLDRQREGVAPRSGPDHPAPDRGRGSLER